MCGIVGAIAGRDIVPVLIEGLKRLEYRGYDSAGIAVLDGGIRRVRRVGRVAEMEGAARAEGLARASSASPIPAGPPTAASPSRNAHPHVSQRRDRGRPQRHHREPRGSSARA